MTGDASVGTDTFTRRQPVRGSNFNDTFTGFNNGTSTLEQFDGWAGDDFIDGGAGSTAPATTATTARPGVPLTARHDVRHGGRHRERPRRGGDVQLRHRHAARHRGDPRHQLDDIYDATGFSASSTNAGTPATTFNEFEGGGGNDESPATATPASAIRTPAAA